MSLNNSINAIFLFITLALITGCYSKQNFIKGTSHENLIKVNGSVIDIQIIDLRDNITNREIKIPALTLPGMKDEISKELQESTKQLIKDEITKQFTAHTDTNYYVEVRLIKGKIGFKANAFNEKEYTDIEIELQTKDQYNNIKNYNSSFYLEVKSIDASPKFVNLLFEKGLLNAIYKCFTVRIR